MTPLVQQLRSELQIRACLLTLASLRERECVCVFLSVPSVYAGCGSVLYVGGVLCV